MAKTGASGRISSVSPAFLLAGSTAVLTISGAGFVAGDEVLADGRPLNTTYLCPSQLTASLCADCAASSGNLSIAVMRGNALTPPFELTVLPIIAAADPLYIAANTTAAITVTGRGFLPNTVILAAGQPLPTTYHSPREVVATLTPSNTRTPGFLLLTAAANLTSTPVSLFIATPPIISSVSPSTVKALTGASISVVGTGFSPEMVITASGQPLVTTYLSSTQLSAFLSVDRTSVAGIVPLAVSGAVSHVTSSPSSIVVQPVIGAVLPSNVPAGLSTQITIKGAGFSPTSVVTAAGQALPTTYISSAELVAALPGTFTTNTGNIPLSISMGDTNIETAPFDLPVLPSISTILPSYVFTGMSTQVTIHGAGFSAHSVVAADGQILPTTFVSPTQLSATLNSSNLSGTTQITVADDARSSMSFGIGVLGNGTVTQTKNPQVAQYSIWLPEGATSAVEFGPDNFYGFITSTASPPPGGGIVSLLVAGMRSYMPYHMRARVTLPDGNVLADRDQLFMTGGPPTERVPSISVMSRPEFGIKGVEMLNFIPGNGMLSALATDLSGNVIWFYDTGNEQSFVFPIHPLPNGNFLIGLEDRIREINLAGDTIREVTLDQVNADLAARGFNLFGVGFHHDVIQLPNGHWVALVSENRTLTNLLGIPGPTTILGDFVVDLDAELHPAWAWSSFDHLDINRHPLNFPDWTHSNALTYDPVDHNLMVSMRHQSWILKLDFQDGAGSGAILWKLGYQGDFSLYSGDNSKWFYAQHNPTIVAESGGTLVLSIMDNGDDRVDDSAGDTCVDQSQSPCYSRALIMDVDQAGMIASEQ